MNASVGRKIGSVRRATGILPIVGGLALGIVAAPAAHAQIDYDPSRNVYSVTSDATISSDITGNDVVVGQRLDGSNVALPHTLTVAGGAKITGFEDDDGGEGGGGGNGYNYGLTLYGNGSLRVEGGKVESVSGEGNGSITIEGGTVGFIGNEGLGKVNISYGSVGTVLSSVSDIAISGGVVGGAFGEKFNSININGGAVTWAQVPYLGSLRLSGGAIGGIDPDVTDADLIGIYQLYPGSLNLFGSDFTRSNEFAGTYGGISGTYSTLTGTLLSGNTINTTLFIADGLYLRTANCGGSQFQPLLGRTSGGGGGTGVAPAYFFDTVASGAWFDPPLVGAYDFAMTDENLFTEILDFPTGIGDANGLFTVSVGDAILGQFAAGMGVRFADYGFAGGVASFRISGIDPTLDSENPTAFPTRLAFDSAFASFSMTGVTGAAATPEPGTLALMGVGCWVLGVGVIRRRAKR